MQNLSGRKFGNYELRERLGRGGMAEVYKAYQPSMDRFVAVKVMLGHLATDDSFIERFKREAQAVGKLRHPHIIDIFDFGIEEDVYYMAMEYLTDGDLKQYIVANQKLPLEDSLKITHDLADALAYAHKQGMIHRDLKPANVMFVEKDKLNVVLTDFGIAKILDATGLTGTGMSVGTPIYMSPEAGSGEDADERADIYALGIIMYEMLVGKVPYNADTPLAVIMKHISAPLPTKADYGADIPEAVEGVMLKCLAKDPNDRYANAGELRDALSGVMRQASSTAKTESVQAKQPATKIAAVNKTRTPEMTNPDAPTTMIGLADTEAMPEESSKRNPMMTYGIIAIVAVIIIAGLFFLFGDQFNTNNDDSTPIAGIISSSETDEVTETAAPNPTDVPVETDVPTEAEEPTDVPAPTAAPTETIDILESIAPPSDFNLQLLSWDINPADARNIEFEAEQLLFDNRLEDAEIMVNEAIAEGEPDIVEYAARTRIAVALGNQELAIETSEFMYELDSRNPNAHINLLDALYMLPANEIDYERALRILEEGQSHDPENVEFMWRRIPLIDDPNVQMALFNESEPDARGWRFVLFAGQFLYEQNEVQRAIPYLEAAAALPPEIFYLHERIAYLLQQSYARLGYMSIFPDYPLILGGEMPPHPENLSVFSNINEILNEADELVIAGDLEGAIEFVSEILEDDPNHADALYARSTLYSQAWDPDNLAGQDAQRLIELDPESIWGYIALSDSWLNYPVYGEEGSFDESVAAIERAYEIDPENPHVLFRIARMGDWQLEAERLFHAEELGASGYRFLFTMGEFLYAIDAYDRSIPYFESFMRYTEQDTYLNIEAFWAAIGALIQVDRAADGVALIHERGILNDTSDFEFFADAAFVAYAAGDFELAEEWSNTALAFSSEAYPAIYVQGLIAYWRDNDDVSALEILTSLEETDVFSRFLNFEFGRDLNIDRARILADEERFEEALAFYNIILEYASSTPWLYEERANVNLALEDVEAARADLQTAFDVSEDPDYRAAIRDLIIELGPATDE